MVAERRLLAQERVNGVPSSLLVHLAGADAAAPLVHPAAASGSGGGGSVARVFAAAFLPEGYPASVSTDYISKCAR